MPPSASETVCPATPVTVNTAYGEASLTVGLVMLTTRSSLGVAPGTGVPLLPKTVPVPSSLRVAVPTALTPPGSVAVRVTVSPLSETLSSTTGVRTSSVVPASVTGPL